MGPPSRMQRSVALLLLAGLLGWAGLSAAAAPFRHFGVADGLPSSQVQAIAQDRAGYLWLATPDGLARYDGLGFTVWRQVPGQPGALPGNAVESVSVDGDDQVWVAVQGQGLWRFDRDGRGFVQRHRMAGAGQGEGGDHPGDAGADDMDAHRAPTGARRSAKAAMRAFSPRVRRGRVRGASKPRASRWSRMRR